VDPYQISVPQDDLSQPRSELCKTKKVLDQSNRSSPIESWIEDLIVRRLAAQIGLPRAFMLQLVACLKIGVVELGHPFDQSNQARCHRWLSPLLVDQRWEQVPIRPLRLDVHINQEPP
jgi:hypothetical protein